MNKWVLNKHITMRRAYPVDCVPENNPNFYLAEFGPSGSKMPIEWACPESISNRFVICEGTVPAEDILPYLPDKDYLKGADYFHVHTTSISFFSGVKDLELVWYRENRHDLAVSSRKCGGRLIAEKKKIGDAPAIIIRNMTEQEANIME